ncbi:MAG: NUDIX hydrolase [Oscillospiraceae bacterium]|nr:NUDIX hydrolase [Oscillospiraceae bacterium]
MADSMDCTFLTEQGKFNFRVGVIISNGTSMLMARNPILPGASYYSVGGRVRFGESLAEAALREVKEEHHQLDTASISFNPSAVSIVVP